MTQLAICKHNEQCISQTGGQFGFVSQTDLKLYDGELVPEVMQSHHIIRSSGFRIFFKCRIPVNTNLNIKNWRYHLKSYWDQQLSDLL